MLIVCMSLAGTIPLIICTLLWFVRNKDFPFKLGKMLLFVSMGFYLLPFQLVKFLLPTEIVQRIDLSSNKDYFVGFQKWQSVTYHDDLYWLPNWLLILFIFWLITVLMFSVYETLNYQHKIKQLRRRNKERVIEIPTIGSVSVKVSDTLTSPYAVGFIRPFIVFPEALVDSDVLVMLYKHEYAHLKNRDSLIKLICLGIICLHWFNPIAILLLVYYSIFSEFIADAEAADGFSDEDKKKYIRLLIELSSERKVMPVIWRNGFLCGKNVLKRRMESTMRKRNLSRTKKVLAACTVVFSVMLGATSVIAYSPLQSSEGVSDDTLYAEAGEFFDFVNDDEFMLDFSESDMIFVSENNECIPVFDSDIEPNALCIHDFEDGYFRKHVSNGTGGCTLYVYDGKKCKKCNHMVVNELVNTITYAKCIHGY